MGEHTPGPWQHVVRNRGEVRVRDEITSPGGVVVVDDVGREEDATFIVRACNSHYELLETLYQYVSDLRYPPEGDSIQRRIERAEAVIAKATGGAA